jgi:uncharacterized membrane protein YgaE (UPF0421/DUF939 family)
MSPGIRRGLRRIVGVIAGAGQSGIAYVIHRFDGWTRTALYLLMLALIAVLVRVAMAEGRERAERERQ